MLGTSRQSEAQPHTVERHLVNTTSNGTRPINSREMEILLVFSRLEKEYPCLQSCQTANEMHKELGTRLRYAESMIQMQQRHCELKPLFPDVEGEVHEAVKGYIACVDEKQKESTVRACERMKSMEQADRARTELLKGQIEAVNSTRMALQPLVSGLQKLSTQCHVATHNSSVKGAIGERNVYEELVNQFPRMEIVPTGQIEHSCDIHVNPTPEDHTTPKTIVEVKFYQHQVPTKEVEKFERDVRQSAAPTALMIATSSISKKPRLHFEWVDEVLVLYMGHSTAHHAPLGVLVLQEIHRACMAFRSARAPGAEGTLVSKDVLEKQLRVTCEEIDEVLGNNTHFTECARDLDRIQMISKGIGKRLEEQCRHHSELVKTICQRFQCDVGIACALTPVAGDKSMARVCTPHERRRVVENLIGRKNQSVATARKHSVGLAALHEIMDKHMIPIGETQSGVFLYNPSDPHVSIGWLDVKATKTVLHDACGCMNMLLVSNVKARMIESCLCLSEED
jgi:hypothetical protein